MSKDRRRTERLPARLFIELHPHGGLSDSKGRGVVVDVSHLGFAIETEADLESNVIYDCHVEFPFALKAQVVRRYNAGQLKRYGLEIVEQGLLGKFLLKWLLKGKKITRKV